MTAKPRNRAATMMLVRQVHTWLAVFVAPSVLFFALTGALQLFHLHEGHGDYTPAPVIEKLGMLHKDQVFALKPHRGPPPGAAKAGPDKAAGPEKKAGPAKAETGDSLSTTLLKALFLGVSLALATSTGLGLWIALTQSRRRKLVWALLIAGIMLPVALVAMG